MKIFVIGGVSTTEITDSGSRERSVVTIAMKQLGHDIAKRGHDLLVCSPFADSADIDAFHGAVRNFPPTHRSAIEFHCPNDKSVLNELGKLTINVPTTRLHRHLYPVTADQSGNINWTYTWLLAQVSAMDRSDAIVALGGQPAKSASLLLALAESRRKRVLPLTFAGGAAGTLFQKYQYELQDRLSERIAVLHEANRTNEVIELVELLAAETSAAKTPPMHARVFISYPRSRPEEADFVEMTFRRRNYDVYRDERDFGAGEHVHREIIEHIHRSTVFLVIWCKEYACSPWCYDELEIALKRHRAGDLALWILCVDDTRIVPRGARKLISYPAYSREELEGRVLALMEQIGRSSGNARRPASSIQRTPSH
jgi:hypothetical protein